MKLIQNTILASVLLLLFSCGKSKGDYDASGVFEATEVIVSSQVSGQIMTLNLEEGQILEAGKPVGYVDSTQLYLKKMQMLATLRSMGGRYANVGMQIASLKQQIATQKMEQKRFDNLVKSNAANQKQLDDINSYIEVLEKQLSAQTENLEKGNTVVSGESSSLEVQIAQVEDQISKCVISSPIQGNVLAKYAEAGEMTNPGKALFKIADTRNMFLRAYITSDQLSQMKIGQTVKVYADFGKKEMKEYPGTITWISDKAEFTPKTIQTRDERANLVYALKIAVKNDGYLKMGMYGELKK